MGTTLLGPHKLRVLVVDDDRDTANSAIYILNHFGYQAEAAYYAEMALEIAGIRPTHVVLLNAAIPKSNGYDLARELRKLPGMDAAFVICVGDFGTEADRQRADEAGCDHHLYKPVNWQNLLHLLEQVRVLDARIAKS
jgi:two-component system CheB/CheR fusion protein